MILFNDFYSTFIKKLFLVFVAFSSITLPKVFSQNSLFLPGAVNWVNVGDLDVVGDQLTVEALIHYTGASVNIVSKHTNPSNVNYLLRIGSFEITTTNGFANFGGLAAAGVTLSSGITYHVAATYNGQFLRYYVNGCLTGEMPWTGNMINNNFATAIGQRSFIQDEQFTGYIDEVRIWNVARTQVEIASNMLNIPNPTLEAGLLAYYKFDNSFVNVQGNATFNGVAAGAPQFQPIPYPYPQILNASVSSSPVICENSTTGAININASGGYTPYSYSIDGVSFGANNSFTNLAPGNYTVYAQSNNNCVVTNNVIIINQPAINSNVITQNATCTALNDGSANVTPSGGNGPYYKVEWLPSGTNNTSINNLSSGNYSVNITDSCKLSGLELVNNGTFENGNVGFSSDYNNCTNCYTSTNDLVVSNYLIGFDPSLHHVAFVGSGAGGSGNFMQVNGSSIPNTNVWCQNISVTPNTYYIFETQVSSLHPDFPAILQFEVNNVLLGSTFNAPVVVNVWGAFQAIWYSGANTTATICIINQNTNPFGNDFGLDNISFKECVSCTENFPFSITVAAFPTAAFSFNNVCFGTSTNFTNTSNGNGGTINQWAWDFTNNGSVDNITTNPTNGYTSAGNYSVELLVTTVDGCKDSVTRVVTVNPMPVANFSAPNVCFSETTSFTNLSTISSGSMTNFQWDFGDGIGTSTLQNPVYAYTNTGTYNVSLTVTSDSGCTNNLIVALTVYPKPTAIFTTANVCQNSATQFNDASVDNGGTINQWAWDFTNNGSVDNITTNPTNAYTSAGNYTVELLVTTTDGCKDSVARVVTVNPIPVANFSAPNVCFSETTSFTNVSTVSTGNITSYTWDFADGLGVNTLQNPTYTFTLSGIYNVSLTVISDSGCIGNVVIPVTVHPLPVAKYSTTNVCDGTIVPFTDQSTIAAPDLVQSWEWNFGDGSPVYNNQTTSHPYSSIGSYNAKLVVVSNFGCSDSITKTVIVHPNPVVDFFAPDTSGCAPLCISFMDQSSVTPGTNMQWEWNVSDGSAVSYSQNFDHCFTNLSISSAEYYSIILTVTSDSGCFSTMTKNNYISVFPNSVADFYTQPTKTSFLTPLVEITNASAGADFWNWDFGDQTISSVSNPVSHTYPDTGTYLITLVTSTQYGCSDTVNKTVVIEPDFVFYIPNAFSPNNDIHNKTFSGKGLYIKEYEMTIFDRWGNLIYKTIDIDLPWDGKLKNSTELAEGDVYVYSIKIIDFKKDEHFYRGVVTLLR